MLIVIVIRVSSCIYQRKKCFSVDLCWFVITSGSRQQPKSITDVRLGGASSGTEVATIDRGGSSPDRRGSGIREQRYYIDDKGKCCRSTATGPRTARAPQTPDEEGAEHLKWSADPAVRTGYLRQRPVEVLLTRRRGPAPPQRDGAGGCRNRKVTVDDGAADQPVHPRDGAERCPGNREPATAAPPYRES